MKFLSFAILFFALAFCGIGDRLKGLSGGGSSNSASNAGGTAPTKSGDASVEKPTLSGAAQEIQDNSTETKWEEQGISWKLPAGWPKMQANKDSFNYGAPGKGFLIASISVMPDSFPADVSINATYDSALEQLKQGNYERVRWLEIDGVKGVEWSEALKEKDGIRRLQWIAFRKYQGQNQQLNVMVSTTGTNFDKQKDTFTAIMYSMKIPKG
jgi:hypothetical protein